MIRFFSLRTRFLAAVITLLLLIGSILTIYIHTSLKESLSHQVQKRGMAIARNVARLAENPSLTENVIALQLLVYDYQRGEEDIEYIFVVDPSGRVLAHTYGAGFPEALVAANPLKPGEPSRIRNLRTDHGPIYDIAVPIMKGELGTVHVGLDQAVVLHDIRQITWRATWLLIALLTVACFGALLMATSLSRPIETLIAAVDAVGQGERWQRVDADEHDEIGHLARAFNRMADHLEATTVSRDEVERLNQQLEATVAERTDQLVRINEELAQEVAERRHVEEEVRRLNDSLEQRIQERTAQLEGANRELEAFSYSVSHDLYAPLRHIEAFSSMLLEDHGPKLDEQAVHYLNRIKAGVVRMGGLIDALLKLSRVGRAEMRRQQVDLSDMATAILHQFQESEPERRVTISVQGQLTALGDRELLGVVLQNLLGNAWKYTGLREGASVEFGCCEVAGETAYFVRDNGIGFDMSHANKLFGVFRRLVSENEFPGTGIGLATVQRIIARHGGRVWAEGAQNQGAVFYFTLG